MSSRWKRAFTEGREAGREGFTITDNPYKDQVLRDEWRRGWGTGNLERSEAQSLIDEEQAWRDLVLAPLADRFDATTEVMEEFVDMIVNVINRGKRV